MAAQTVLILDFGGQYKELIARRVRECGVYSIVKPGDISLDKIREIDPIGIILTGGPNSVYEKESPHCDKAIFDIGIPVLGICYGMQLLSWSLGGEVSPCSSSEYGSALVQDVFQAQVLGVLVVGVQAQHATLQLIHNVGGGGIHGIHKALRQSAMLGQDLAEIVQLFLGGQTAEQQQPDHFLKHEAVVAISFLHDLVDVDAAVDQLAGGGDHMSFLILFVAHNVTHVGQAG